MRTLLIDEKGVMYWASLSDIRDLRAGIRRPSTVLPSLERIEMRGVTTDEWERREYLDFLCNTDRNGRKHKEKKVRTRRGFVSAYRYLQPLIGFQDGVAARIDGKLYFVPMADALGYTLGLESRDEVRDSAGVKLGNSGFTNYLIVV
ncbi:hypothetical protein BV674P5_00044 [Phocaeicola phage BV674P5]|nr:hypothetical protein BV674P5_00044 [Phocaeicola phage BV674P5]